MSILIGYPWGFVNPWPLWRPCTDWLAIALEIPQKGLSLFILVPQPRCEACISVHCILWRSSVLFSLSLPPSHSVSRDWGGGGGAFPRWVPITWDQVSSTNKVDVFFLLEHREEETFKQGKDQTKMASWKKVSRSRNPSRPAVWIIKLVENTCNTLGGKVSKSKNKEPRPEKCSLEC